MATANRDRQKRWQDKQAAAGRKRFTVIVDGDVYEILMAHKARTGETLSGVVNRAVRQLAGGRGEAAGHALTDAPSPPRDTERGIDEARSMIRRLLTLGKG